MKQALAEEGYTLLSVDGRGAVAVLTYLCPNSHNGKVRWRDWKYSNVRCKDCQIMEKKKRVEEELKKEGYEVREILSGKGQTRIKAFCPKRHAVEFTLASWNRGARCKKCIQQEQRVSFQKIKKSFKRMLIVILK